MNGSNQPELKRTLFQVFNLMHNASEVHEARACKDLVPDLNSCHVMALKHICIISFPCIIPCHVAILRVYNSKCTE